MGASVANGVQHGMPAAWEVAEHSIEAPVAEVVLFEDRAQVRRRGRVAVKPGQMRVRFLGVAPVLADRTLSLSGTGIRVINMVVERALRRREERVASEGGALEEQVRQLTAQQQALGEQKALITGQRQLVEQMIGQRLEEAAVDAGWGTIDAETIASDLQDLWQKELALHEEVLDLDLRREERNETLADLRARLRAAERPDLCFSAEVLADIQVDIDDTVEIELGYVVPIACWRPQHSAQLVAREGGVTICFTTDACVWQRTGEDWHGVELRLSTQRPSLGFDPPMLQADRLATRPKPEQMEVQTREQELRTTGLGTGRKVADRLPGIDDGGTGLSLAAAEPASVPSDGRPYRVPMVRFEAPAEERLELVAELAPAAVRKVTTNNPSDHPILAGPVDLLADGGLAGQAPVDFVAPGERFALGFGVDPAIRVRRSTDKVDVPPAALSRHESTRHSVKLLLSNISSEPRTFTVSERIPVSEVKEVEVAFDAEQSTPGAELDDNGFVRWQVTLSAGGTRTVDLRYTVRKRKGVAG